MRNVLTILFVMFLTLTLSGLVNATPYNVAEGKSVSLNGAAFFTGGWGDGKIVEPSTVVDGVFLKRSTQWDQEAVWWDSNDGAERYLTIDLEGIFSIESFVVQADDNDAYILSYRDIMTDTWVTAWDVPNFDIVNNEEAWGMQTRPDPFDDMVRYVLPATIITDSLRFEGDWSVDNYYSVSEIQAYGAPVPEPATITLLSLGIAGLAGYRKKFRKQT